MKTALGITLGVAIGLIAVSMYTLVELWRVLQELELENV